LKRNRINIICKKQLDYIGVLWQS